MTNFLFCMNYPFLKSLDITALHSKIANQNIYTAYIETTISHQLNILSIHFPAVALQNPFVFVGRRKRGEDI